ncbi:MAG: dihydropyrimidine dehydrogenase [Spirochaetes bacterium GWC1_27_15]|nr:MAG: dihydropyrimidine dehydrogenase [Spirochaetes bacterium GWB1_27_13]OHD21310.1 MAG: dihydropyrimidine dehydrogenase [Spirochaetes bacterium GWC1_27_15]
MEKHIIDEAKRCLQCRKPKCKEGCPVKTPINEIINLLLTGKINDAGEMLFKNNPLSVICGLICPQERFCEGNCILIKKANPIQISSIEHYISDYYLNRLKFDVPKNKCKKIAIIGSGPSGITVAFMLVERGYEITIFEAEEKIGGILQYGIPDYRLPKYILEKLKEILIKFGVKIRPNTLIGPVISIDDLFRDGYKAIFIGTGVWSPKPLRIKGESFGNVHYAINYLKNPDVFNLGNKVCVIGAGNVAMDVARTALRKGVNEVYIMYRRSEDDIPATTYEIEYAKIDGVKFEFFKTPVEIVEEGIKYICTQKVKLEDGKEDIVNIEGSEDIFECDSIIIAVSQNPRSNIVSNTKGIDINKFGLIITDENGRTTKDGVFASGDVVTGARTVVEAVHYSKKACDAIEEYIADKCSVEK